MAKRVDFVNNATTVEDDFLDDLQEILTRSVFGVRLERTGSAQVRATIDGQGSLITDSGKMRFVTASPTLTVSGAAGSRNLYAIGGADSGADPSINTNKAWTLEAASGLPAGANPRKLGTLDYDGVGVVSNIRYTAGQQPPADLFNAFIIQPNDPYGVPLSIQGLAGQASNNLLQVGSSSSITDRLVLTTAGMLQLPVAGATGGLQLAGEAASNLYRSAASTLKTDGSFVVAGNLTVNGNVQIDGSLTVTGTTTFTSSSGATIAVPVGSATSPSIFFTGDTNTGFFSPGADQFAVTVNGAAIGTFSSSGLVVAAGITSQGNSRIGSNDAHTLGFFSVAGVARRTGYSVTNGTTDRTYDANATSLDEIADVLSTLISDLKAYGLIG